MINKATYAGSSNTMCVIEPSMVIVPADDPQVTEWIDVGNTIFPYIPAPQTMHGTETAKLIELKTTYEEQSILPVASAGTFWNGGEASAHRINGKAETMIHLNVILGTIHDISNIPHEMDATAMKDIAAGISVEYEAVFKNYQTKKNEVAFCVNDPDVVDKVSCINGVTW